MSHHVPRSLVSDVIESRVRRSTNQATPGTPNHVTGVNSPLRLRSVKHHVITYLSLVDLSCLFSVFGSAPPPCVSSVSRSELTRRSTSPANQVSRYIPQMALSSRARAHVVFLAAGVRDSIVSMLSVSVANTATLCLLPPLQTFQGHAASGGWGVGLGGGGVKGKGTYQSDRMPSGCCCFSWRFFSLLVLTVESVGTPRECTCFNVFVSVLGRCVV